MSKPLVVVVVLALTLLGAGYWLFYRSTPQGNALRAREVATRGLADYLVKHQSDLRVLVIANPFVQHDETPREIVASEEAGLRGLREGLGEDRLVVSTPRLKPEAQENPRAVYIDPETTTPLSFLVAPDAFDQLATDHAACNLIVSLIGLPAELSKVRCWAQAGPPRFALLLPDLRMIGNAEAVRRAVKGGKLLAFVLNHPEAPGAQTRVSSDWKAEFAKRFLLVTGENVDQMIQAYPKLFVAR